MQYQAEKKETEHFFCLIKYRENDLIPTPPFFQTKVFLFFKEIKSFGSANSNISIRVGRVTGNTGKFHGGEKKSTK